MTFNTDNRFKIFIMPVLVFPPKAILMGKRELVALLGLSSWCLLLVERLFLAARWGCVRFVIVVFPNHTHLLFLMFMIG